MVHLVLEHGRGETEVDLRLLNPEATVGDLTALLDPTAPGPRGLLVDGERHGPDVVLGALGLVHGSRICASDGRPADDDRAERRSGTVVAVIGGPDAGRTEPLRPGAPVTVGRSAPSTVVVADPTASAAHVRIELIADGSAVVTELGSTNGTYQDGVRANGTTPLPVGSVLQLGATQLQVRTLDDDDRPVGGASAAGGAAGTTAFNRPPRAALPLGPDPRALPDPPAEPRGAQGMGLAAMIIGPLLMGGVMVAIYKDIRFAAFMLLSPVLGIGNWLSSRRQAKKDHVSSTRDHRAAVATLDAELRADAVREVAVRERLLPDLAEVTRRAGLPSMALWQRRPGHADWLRLRAGTGTVPWNPLELDPRHPRPDLDELAALHATLRACPVEVDLSDGGVVGVVGDRAAALAVARSLVCQAAVHHGPADLPMVVVTSSEHRTDWDWTKWLPHLRDADGTGRLLAADPESARALLGALAGREAPEVRHGAVATGPTLLLVLDDVTLLEGRRSPARDLLRGTAGPVAGIVIAPTEDQLPAMCSTVITTLAAVGEIEVRQPHIGLRLDQVNTAGLQEATARACARDLARFEDPELGLSGGGLPGMVRLLPLLGFDDLTPEAVAAGWAHLPVDPAPATPLGVGEDGTLSIDLATDGPHALIGGTTGSGKSELLRSMVAGMAARVDPDHLVFVLVDYKGGSAFDECARLPHTVGMVTDLDESLGERALRSLEAELHHRERTLRDAGAQDLPAYLAVGSPAGPLPRLVVVIDEFATLATELPDFLGALVGIAQRGRSLGVHLILATQRPQGAVNANIKANTNLRIALRVQDAGDSADIIDQPSAADLSRSTPGRAYVRRGPGEVELVQTALSTAIASSGPTRPVELVPFRFTPVDPPIAATSSPDDDAPSDLHRLVEAVRGAFTASGAAAPRQPWLPVLTEDLTFADLAAATSTEAAAGTDPDADLDADLEPAPGPVGRSGLGIIPLGLVDDPAHQRQCLTGWDAAAGHFVVAGAVGSGTTTALLALARSLAEGQAPSKVHLFAIDLGGGGLSELDALPHCAGVVGGTDRAGQHQLVRRLRSELSRRRELDSTERDHLPTLVTFIDGIGAFLAEHDDLDGAELMDAFVRLVNEGAEVDILFAFAGDRVHALPQRLAGGIGQRLLLRLPDPADYTSIGVRLRAAPKIPAGRGWSTDGLVTQVAWPGSVDEWNVETSEQHLGPTPLRPFPARVQPVDLPSASLVPDQPIHVPVGLDEDHQPVSLVLHDGDHALVAGPPRSGVSTTLGFIGRALLDAQATVSEDFLVIAVRPERSPLAAIDGFDASGTADELADVLATARSDHRRWFILVDDAVSTADEDGRLDELIRNGRPGLHVIAGARSGDLHAALGHWTRRVRKSRTGVLLRPDLSVDGELLMARLPRRVSVRLRPGRGFVVEGGEAVLAQVAAVDAEVQTLG